MRPRRILPKRFGFIHRYGPSAGKPFAIVGSAIAQSERARSLSYLNMSLNGTRAGFLILMRLTRKDGRTSNVRCALDFPISRFRQEVGPVWARRSPQWKVFFASPP